MKVYIDKDFKCHISEGDGFRPVEVIDFDGKCSAFIEGHRYVPSGESWTRHDGVVFSGEMRSAWKDYAELEAVQRDYERNLIAQYESMINELYAEVAS